MGDSVGTGLPQAQQCGRDGRAIGPSRGSAVRRQEPRLSNLSGGTGPGPDPLRRTDGRVGLPSESARFPDAGPAGRLRRLAPGSRPDSGMGTGISHRGLAGGSVGIGFRRGKWRFPISGDRVWTCYGTPSLALLPGASRQPSPPADIRSGGAGFPLS